jgi:hypothetical protein
MLRKRNYEVYAFDSACPGRASLGLTLAGEADLRLSSASMDSLPEQSRDQICDLCRRIDLKSILESNVRSKAIGNGLFISNLDHINITNGCAMCQFFRDMRIYPSQKGSHDYRFNLVAFSALTQLRLSGLGILDKVMLAVVGRSTSKSLSEDDRLGYSLGPYILSSNIPKKADMTPYIRGRSLNHERVDFTTLVDWVDFCRLYHPRRCPKHETHSIEGFRVIDCEMRQVIPAPDSCEYCAVSYVWGNTEAKTLLPNNIIPDMAHPVIEDSITVCMRLGFRYLWVDRYCIRHENVHETQRQIGSMDSIYRESALTIIAATLDPKSGLPGVGSTPRLRQPSIQVGNQLLVSTLPNPKDIIRQSVWNTRAWTFQEGLLSTKRLVFTDYDVYFQCMCKHFRESIALPLTVFHPQKPGHLRRQADAFQVFPRDGPGRDPPALIERIQEYSKKSLSFRSDGLNAMLGIFKTFEQARIRIWHLHGIPLYCGDPHRQPLPDHLEFTSEGLGRALTWTLTGEPERIAQLPSWSWVGWSGFDKFCPDTGIRQVRAMDTHFYGPPNNINPFDKRPIISFEMELKNGAVVNWENLQYTIPYRDWTEVISNVIRVYAWTFDINLRQDEKTQRWKLSEFLKATHLSDDLFERKEDHRSYDHLLNDRLLGVIVEMDYKPIDRPATSFLVLKFRKDLDLWERVDCFKIRGGRYWSENWPDEAWYGNTRLYRRKIRLG